MNSSILFILFIDRIIIIIKYKENKENKVCPIISLIIWDFLTSNNNDIFMKYIIYKSETSLYRYILNHCKRTKRLKEYIKLPITYVY